MIVIFGINLKYLLIFKVTNYYNHHSVVNSGMIWLLFAFLTALFESLKDVASKRGLQRFDEYVIAASLILFQLPFLVPLLFFIEIPDIGENFWSALVAGTGLNLIAITFYIKAIKVSDLSITVPIVNLTPLFLLVTSPVILGEYPSPLGYPGILLIVVGAYVLNIKSTDRGYLGPIRSLFSQRGPRYMAVTAFFWSISANVDKVGVLNSSPVFWAISIVMSLGVGMGIIMVVQSRKHIQEIPQNLRILFPIGFFGAVTLLAQMTAISLTLVAYVISVKRLSTALSVIWGHVLFKEVNIKERLAGVFIMIAGVILITLA